MTKRDLLRTHTVNQSLAPAARVTGTYTGTAVDTRGYDGAIIAVSFGAYTDGTHTPTVLHSSDGTTYTACTFGTDTDGAADLAAVSSSSGANAIQQIGYIGGKRYVAVVMTVTGATTGALSSASVILGYPHRAPTV